MRTPLQSSLLLFTALFMVASGCTKKEAPQPTPGNGTTEVTKEKLSGSYQLAKVEGRTSSQRSDITETWFSSYAGDCTRDDVTIFNPDNSFVVLDGTVACDESTDDTGTWELVGKTGLRIDSDTATIEEFTATTLRVVSPVYSTAQSDIIFTYTRH